MSDITDEDIKEVIYKKGRRMGIIIGATATLIILSMAYIATQGMVYVD
ncbi:MAG: hypothetical protein GTN97_07150 [Nitrosopumilaceae archaeon]|nr:hypothetical protein [Nitrosopumilaceae archaeon]